MGMVNNIIVEICVIKIQQQWVIIRGESRIEWADIAVGHTIVGNKFLKR